MLVLKFIYLILNNFIFLKANGFENIIIKVILQCINKINKLWVKECNIHI